MDVYRIPRSGISKKHKRVWLSLHHRIERFKERNQRLNKIAGRLLAIKWIGNDGSHFGGVSVQDVLLAFELLESCIEKTYEDRESKLDQAAKAINKLGGKKVRKPNIRGRLKKIIK